MKEIGAVTIGKLIEAHYAKDEHKFKAYAEFIAEAYKERGEERAERIIRSRIDGSYKSKPVVVTLDKEIQPSCANCKHKTTVGYRCVECDNYNKWELKE